MNRPYIKKCITICIQGHGGIVRKSGGVNIINSELRNNASILNIPGGIGSSGLMEANCVKMTIKGDKKRGISDINLCGQPLDLMSMEYFHNLYQEISKKSNVTGCDVSKECIEIIRENIPLIYGNANIPYFHSDDDVTTNPTEAFRLSNPYYNKMYTMYPSTHEYCDPETTNCKMGECALGECKLLRKGLRDCPEYGITVVHSTIPSDNEYTLSGLPFIQNNLQIEEENRLAINLNQDEGHKPLRIRNGDDDDDDEYLADFDEDGNETSQKQSCYIFWKLKLTRNKIQETREIQSNITYYQRKKQGYNGNAELIEECDKKIRSLQGILKKTELMWQERITAYNEMTNVFERNIPISSLTGEEVDTLPFVSLSKLIDIFINGMKYDHIYIIDPTCNSCEFTGNHPTKLFKTAAFNILERIQTKRSRAFESPSVYKKRRNTSSSEFGNDFKRSRLSVLPVVYEKRYNNPSDGFNNRKQTIVDLKRRRSIGGKHKIKRTKKYKNTRKIKRVY
jgi:hypothetical protein